MEAVGSAYTIFVSQSCSSIRQNANHQGMQVLLRGHTDKVNAVKFLLSPLSRSSILLSGSVDKTIRVWRDSTQASKAYEELTVLTGHSGSVNCLAVAPSTDTFVSGSADATVKIWQFRITDEREHVVLLQNIETNPRFFPLALAMTCIGLDKDLVLALAGTKSFIQIYVAQNTNDFVLQATLTGHEAWVRSLDFRREKQDSNSDILLASASQDKYIRLWRIRQGSEVPQLINLGDTVLNSSGKSLSNKAHWLNVSHISYSLTFEALLLGHDDWIYTVSWYADNDGLRLLSASADSSLAFWEAEANSGIWVCTIRLGEISEQKGATTATGSTGGFWIGLWSPNGDRVVSLGRTGSWRLWSFDVDQNRWDQGIGVGGHTKALTDISWAKDGTYLLSTGLDQTTRLYTQWNREKERTWHEFARPQIHGYNINCIDSIKHYEFISGADEKLLRVFDEPRATADLLSVLCGIHNVASQNMPDAAHIPVLGLSNKIIEPLTEEMQHPTEAVNNEEANVSRLMVQSKIFKHPPIEDDLARHTLWPEIEKLYGHGYEISAVASSHDGEIIASACKASSIDHAVIRIYTTKDWREVKPSLIAHALTVTCLRFSRDDQYLLSVGRDRQWVIFERDEFQRAKYKMKNSNQKGHSRMILSASWAPLAAGRVFATAGRDKAVKIWRASDEETKCVTTISAIYPITSVDIFPECIKDVIVAAIGTEVGDVILYTIATMNLVVQHIYKLEDS